MLDNELTQSRSKETAALREQNCILREEVEKMEGLLEEKTEVLRNWQLAYENLANYCRKIDLEFDRSEDLLEQIQVETRPSEGLEKHAKTSKDGERESDWEEERLDSSAAVDEAVADLLPVPGLSQVSKSETTDDCSRIAAKATEKKAKNEYMNDLGNANIVDLLAKPVLSSEEGDRQHELLARYGDEAPVPRIPG